MILTRFNSMRTCQRKPESVPPVFVSESVPAFREKIEAGPQEFVKQDLLGFAVEIAPFIRGLLGEEVGIAVADRQRFLYCHSGGVGLQMKPGDPVKEGSLIDLALRTGIRQVNRVEAEVYGVPYIGVSFPITDPGSGEITGALCMITPISRQEKLIALAKEMENQINIIAMSTTNLSATSEELAATTDNLNSNAQKIRSEIGKTDGIIALIEEIAEQTHLLGLNAAIEAARVGDAGRGFNVVAGEIRKLSQDTQRSVKEIMQTLHDVQRSIMDLTNSIEQMSAAAQQQAASSQEINASISELVAVSGQLKKLAGELLL
ncbi:MAG TPA: chemotaxis protein [Desulfotomaculum sp.]|nr:chemotaxis protein [Desulfotomaculum sp.]